MKNLTLISALILISLLLSCQQKAADTPESFQDKSVINDISSLKRSNPDLITNLYNEILEKNQEIKALEKKITKLKNETAENTENINKYFSNNQDYYNAAYNNIELIQDSVLREKIFEKLSENENSFNTKTEKITSLLADISQKHAELNDCYNALKILVTMHQNEEYQNNNLPDTVAVYNLKGRYDTVIKLIKEKINE